MRQYLTFKLDGASYGVRVEHVNSVLDLQPVTPLRHDASIVTGLTNVRGNVVPIFDPREVLRSTRVDERSRRVDEAGAAGGPDDDRRGLLVFEVDNGTLLPSIGLVVDEIGKVIDVDDGDVAAVPAALPGGAARLFEGFSLVSGVRHSLLNLAELASRDVLFGQEGARRG